MVLYLFIEKKDLIVIGGGDTACEESTYLTNIATKVYTIVRRSEKQMRASKTMYTRVKNNPKIEIIDNSVVKQIIGTLNPDGTPNVVTNAILQNVSTGKETTIPIGGVFFAIGHTPSTQFLSHTVEDNGTTVKLIKKQVPGKSDEQVYVVRDSEIRIAPDGYIQTVKGSSQCLKPKTYVELDNAIANDKILSEEIFPGVFACGDCQDKVYRQAVTAAGTGCMAALEAERYIGLLEAAHVAAGKSKHGETHMQIDHN